MIQPPFRVKNCIQAMKGRNLTFIMERKISGGDRFSLPSKQLRAEFLTDQEKTLLKLSDMDVVLVEPSLETCRLTLKRWEASKGRTCTPNVIYVLGGGGGGDDGTWNRVVSRNLLREGDAVGVWSFRIGVERKLCFAIARLDSQEIVEHHDEDEGEDGGIRRVGGEEGQDLLNICPGYLSGPDWIDSYYDDNFD